MPVFEAIDPRHAFVAIDDIAVADHQAPVVGRARTSPTSPVSPPSQPLAMSTVARIPRSQRCKSGSERWKRLAFALSMRTMSTALACGSKARRGSGRSVGEPPPERGNQMRGNADGATYVTAESTHTLVKSPGGYSLRGNAHA